MTIRTKIKLFGAFRQFGNGQEIEIDLPETISLSQLRQAFINRLFEIDSMFDRAELVSISAFANENGILTDEEPIQTKNTLAILPPVCGG